MTNQLLSPAIVEELHGVMRQPREPDPDAEPSVVDEFFEHLAREGVTVAAVEKLARVHSKAVHVWSLRRSRPTVTLMEKVLHRLDLRLTLEPIPDFILPAHLERARMDATKHTGRRRNVVRATSPLLREVSDMVDAFEIPLGVIAAHAGVSLYSITEWRLGVTGARLSSVEKLARSLGHKVVLRRASGGGGGGGAQ